MVKRVIQAKRLVILALAVAPLFLSGCVLEQILDDIVNEGPQAVIQASPRQGEAPLEVDFSGLYSNDDSAIVEYRWSFGDPTSTMSVLDPATTHTFSSPGTYLVKLTVMDDEGEVDTEQVAIVVTDAPPIAQASVSNENPLPGNSVIFTASGSYDLQGEIVSYDWDYGDEQTGTGKTSEHTYTQGGYYVCVLTVTDNSGATTRATLGINVLPGQSDPGAGSSTCGDIKPLAIITSKYFSCTSNGRVGDNITYDGVASRPAVGSIVSYHWDFGDETTGSGPTVSHVYSKSWKYVVTLTIVDEGGGTSTATGSISIGNAACE